MNTEWLREALFAGMTANAFKLGTVLTCGWFWPRVGGCSILYRGDSMETIDFRSILVVAEMDASEISPPEYVQHNSSSTYFYVIRRANRCGDQEYTLSAAVRVSIDPNGDLAKKQPNSVFEVKAEQRSGNKIMLIWYYCPLDQQQEPISFNIYYDGGTGQIDYECALATILYKGRMFYNYQSESLSWGRYLFCMTAEGADGAESSNTQVRIQLDAGSLSAVDILKIECV
jgi:hypothetical protein